MKKMDLRQVGTILGLPIYVDFDSVPDDKPKTEPFMSSRDHKEAMIHSILNQAFGIKMQIEEPEYDPAEEA